MQSRLSRVCCALLLPLCLTGSAQAQDVEPRRWTHLPNGMNLVGVGVVATKGDLLFDPVLLTRDVEMEVGTFLVSYLRTFGVWGRSARIDCSLPLQSATWKGFVNEEPAETRRDGWGDPRIRLSVNFIGAPALRGREYGQYRAAHGTNTVVGAGVAVTLPWGEYLNDKLLNLGGNRTIVRPQLGAVHTRGHWSFELTGSVFWFSTNDDFWNGNTFEQKELWAIQGHVVRTLPHRMWVSASGAWGVGGRSTVNGEQKDDKKENAVFSASYGFPVGNRVSGKLAYWRMDTQTFVGSDTHNLALAFTIRF